MTGLLIVLLIFCLLCVAVYYITSMPGVPAFVRPIAYAVLCVLVIIWLVGQLGGGLGLGHLSRC